MPVRKSLFGFLCAGLAVMIVWFGLHSYRAITAVAPTRELPEDLPVIIIDAGHGGFDGGAVGVDGIVEKDINLAIAKNLYDLFTVHGFEAVLTRDADISLEDAGLDTIRKRKNSDIHNRKALADSYPNCILLSIHQNKFPQSKYFGAQVFYGPENESSEALGKTMQSTLISMLDPSNMRMAKPCTDSVYLIYHAPMPALLIECGFLSNPQEAGKLSSAEYQRKTAFAIFCATAKALGLEAPDAAQNGTTFSQAPILPESGEQGTGNN